MNSEQAIPTIQIPCQDRVRIFCLNLEAFCVLEEHLGKEAENPSFKIFKDFDWDAVEGSVRLLTLILWAGLHFDARMNDKEPWTVDKARGIADLLGVQLMESVFYQSLKRVMPPEQYADLLEKKEEKKIPKKVTPKKIAA